MTSDEELRAAAATLENSVAVVGWGSAGDAIAERIDDCDAPDAIVIAADLRPPLSLPPVPALSETGLRIGVVTLPDQPAKWERKHLDRLAGAVDSIVVAPRVSAEAGGLADAVETFVALVHNPGFVNLDLADARTVLEASEVAALGRATGAVDAAAGAVADAFDATTPGFEAGSAGGVLLDLVGGPALSVDAVDKAVSAARERVGPGAHLIWGAAVEQSLEEELVVRLVAAGVEDRRVVAGDDCPRCGAALSSYVLGGRRSVACDDCGYAGVPIRL